MLEKLPKFSVENNLPHYRQLREINGLFASKLEKVVDAGETYLVYINLFAK